MIQDENISMKNSEISNLICCPCSEKSPLSFKNYTVACTSVDCKHSRSDQFFKIVSGCPILVSEDRTDTVCKVGNIHSYIQRPHKFIKNVTSFFNFECSLSRKNCKSFIEECKKIASKPKILIVGGGIEGAGTEDLYSNDGVQVISTDIYLTNLVDVISDAHYLPFKNEVFDGVWIQAVLEHVVDPGKVVSELHRVLKSSGVIYAETPFMQQVHEGPYDFTRFTVLGHRYLFKRFDAITFGGIGGSNVVLAWAIRYLVWALFRSRFISRVIGFTFQKILAPLSFVLSKDSMHDSSSGVYFMGNKRSKGEITHAELVNLYRGCQ